MIKMPGIRGARTLSSLGCIAALLAAAPGAAAEQQAAPPKAPPGETAPAPSAPPSSHAPPSHAPPPKAPPSQAPPPQAPPSPDTPPNTPAPEAQGPEDPSWQVDGQGAVEDRPEGDPVDPWPTAGGSAGAGSAGSSGEAARPAPAPAESTSPPAAPNAAPPSSVDPANPPGPEGASTEKGDAPPRYALPASTERSIPPAPDPETVPFTHHQLRWEVQLGARNAWIPDGGFDAFAENDSLTQLSLGVGRGVFRNGRWSVAALGFWEIGSKGATVRSAGSSYSAQRFSVALEGRYHLRHWLYGYGRLAPGATRTVARLDAPGQSFGYESRTWVVSTDVALGAALHLIGNPDGREPGERLWFFAEGGYGWSATQNLLLRPTSGAPERSSSLDLGEMSLSGGFGRVGLLLAF